MLDRIAGLADAYRRARAELGFLDANLWLGRPRNPEFATGFDMTALRGRLARYGIAGGIVSHFGAIPYGAEWANQEVLAAVAGGGLWVGITLLSEMFQSPAAGAAYLDECIGRGARLARLFPVTHNFTLRAWCSGPLLQALTDRRLPLTLWHTETSWDEIRGLCENYPTLPIIIEGAPKKIIYYNRSYYPLLERCPNLRLELHNLVAYLGVEDIVARFGAGRLVFGSYMPVYDPNAALMQVTHARISPADKACIAQANLSRLIAGVVKP